MKRILTVLAMGALVPALLLLQACDRDGVIGTDDDDVENPINLLVAKRSAVAPAIDGVADDAAWAAAEPILMNVSVVDIPAFAGYGNRQHQVEMKATYDDQAVYFLARYNDASLDTDREPWYVDPGTGTWQQESRYPVVDTNGNVLRQGYYEDKFSMMWEASPVEGFKTSGCGVGCHVGLSPVQNAGGKSALKYTNNFGEIMDMWHLKFVRTGGGHVATMDDQYTDWTSTAGNGGRHSDPGTGSYSNNSKTIDGKSVPRYIIPGATQTYYWITTDQIDSGEAQEVMALEPSGTLVLADGTRIEASDQAFQRDGGLMPPSVYVRAVDGDRADIGARMAYDGKIITVEISRPLITGSEFDVQFEPSMGNYVFGIAVFDNAAIAHATSSGTYFLRFE